MKYETYQPYLTELSQYIKKYAPKSKQVIHQTWAYEQGSHRLCTELGYSEQKEMFEGIELACKKASADLGNIPVIPCGEAFQHAVSNGIAKIHRDTFHASLGVGRYILGAVWYEALTGRSIAENTFSDFDEAITEDEIKIAKRSVAEAMGKKKKVL